MWPRLWLAEPSFKLSPLREDKPIDLLVDVPEGGDKRGPFTFASPKKGEDESQASEQCKGEEAVPFVRV
ncbi:hypothetical protein niasHS_005912 [Heterodera schachtii]|uniref:Uncharacterized protein n=1 Tax=Heterodera schachtii TaxID=97005 RepID=A0ABD2JSJ8_HETSC